MLGATVNVPRISILVYDQANRL